MNPKKTGKLFIILMIAMLAYGSASAANALNLGTDLGVGIIPSDFNFNSQQKINEISDPSFSPVYLVKHVLVNNTTTVNDTTTTTPANNTTTPVNQTKT
jgi:hypothetical protein